MPFTEKLVDPFAEEFPDVVLVGTPPPPLLEFFNFVINAM
jgi:hypothetical protein